MTISVLQVASIDPTTGATTSALAFGSNITPGSWIVALTMGNFATVSGVADTLGNTLTLRKTALSATGPGNQKLYIYAGPSPSGGADTVTFTYGVSTTVRPVYLLEIGGVATAAYDVGNNNDQTTPTTGTDAVVSGSASNTTQPALIIGASLRLFNTGQPAAGTGFTDQSGGSASHWGSAGSGSGILVETKRVTATGSQQATWTAAANAEHMSVMIVLDELAPNLVATGVSGSAATAFLVGAGVLSAIGISGSAGSAAANVLRATLVGESGSLGIASLLGSGALTLVGQSGSYAVASATAPQRLGTGSGSIGVVSLFGLTSPGSISAIGRSGSTALVELDGAGALTAIGLTGSGALVNISGVPFSLQAMGVSGSQGIAALVQYPGLQAIGLISSSGIVSMVPPTGPMPSCIGLNLWEALDALQKAGILVPSRIGYFGTFPVSVYWQSGTPAAIAQDFIVTAQSIGIGANPGINPPIVLTVWEPPTSVIFP